jgi:L-fuconate dehydratase
MFKQLMQAGAIKFCQIDSCRLGGVNEVLAVLLMAAKFGCLFVHTRAELGCVSTPALINIRLHRRQRMFGNRIAEYVDHLHEHFVTPVVMRGDGTFRQQHRVTASR